MAKQNELAQFLKAKRELSKLSQKQVADKLGYSTSQFISNWERGLSNPPFKAVKKLASLYKVSLDEIFNIVLKTTIEEVTTEFKKKFYGKKTS